MIINLIVLDLFLVHVALALIAKILWRFTHADKQV